MCERHFDWSSGKSSTVPELLPKKYMPLTELCSFRWTSTLPSTLLTFTTLGNPLTMLMDGLLLVGNPVPSHATAPVAPKVQPETFKLAGLTSLGITPARKAACTSAIVSGMLLAQSPVVRTRQFPASGIETMDGLVTPPNWFPTSYRWPS